MTEIVIPIKSSKFKPNGSVDPKKIAPADQKSVRKPVKKAPARPRQIYLCTLWAGDRRAAKLLSWLVSWSRKAVLTRPDQPGLWNANTAEDFKRVLDTKSKREVYRCIKVIERSGAMVFETGGFQGKKATFSQPTKRFLEYMSEATTAKKAITLRAQLVFKKCNLEATTKPLNKQPVIKKNGTKVGLCWDDDGTKVGRSNTFYPSDLPSFNPSKPGKPGKKMTGKSNPGEPATFEEIMEITNG